MNPNRARRALPIIGYRKDGRPIHRIAGGAQTPLNDLRTRVEELRAEIVTLSEIPELDETQEARWTAANAEFDTRKAELDAAEAREARVTELRNLRVNKPDEVRVEPTDPEVIVRTDPFEALERRSGQSDREYRQTLVDANLRAIEGHIDDGDNQAHFEKVLKRHATSKKPADVAWARNLLARQRPEYVDAFSKLMMGRSELLTAEERVAMSDGTSANGGYLLPTHLDPTIILTNAGSGNELRTIARVVTLTEGKVWHGVTSAGVTASYDPELAEVSDDSPTFGNPAVTAHKAQSLVQASIEAFEDIAGLQSDVLMMFADARDRLEGNKFAVGGGTNEPFGIFTVLAANTNVNVTSTTAAAIGLVDVHKVYAAVPRRFRSRSSWFMAPTYNLAIKALGAAVSASYTTDLTQTPSDTILGKRVVESDDAVVTQTTTALDAEIIVGDFSNFVIVDKPGGMSVDFIPHMFNVANNLPDGRRAWYAYWRSGSNSVNDLAFRLLTDKTSA
jgi:HK97 family phage major capsid protein